MLSVLALKHRGQQNRIYDAKTRLSGNPGELTHMKEPPFLVDPIFLNSHQLSPGTSVCDIKMEAPAHSPITLLCIQHIP